MNKWFAIAVALAGCGTEAVEAPTVASSPEREHLVESFGDTDSFEASPEVATLEAPIEDSLEAASMGGTQEAEGTEAAELTSSTDDSLASAEPSLEPAEPEIPMHTFELKRGESLHHFARWSEQPIEEVARLSDLALDGSYAVGTQVKLQLTPEDRSRVEARRDAHHQTRAVAYLDSRGPHSTGFYTVKTGDTAWKIAQSTEAVPVWLIESMNPSVDLERLRPGEELLVPVFVDVTASLDDDEE